MLSSFFVLLITLSLVISNLTIVAILYLKYRIKKQKHKLFSKQFKLKLDLKRRNLKWENKEKKHNLNLISNKPN